PRLHRTADRRWRGLRRATGLDRSLGYCGPMSTGTHAGAAQGFPADFVARCLDDALAHGGRIHGITGLQGTGKSTLAAQMAALAAERGKAVAVMSVDDAYLDHDERARLALEVHPLLATRGPPGTHDVALACRTLDALRAGEP